MSTDAVDRVNVHWIYIFLLYSYCTVQQEKSRLTTCTYCHGYSYVFYGLYKVISIYNRHRLLSCIIAMCDAFWPKWGLAEGLALLKKVGKTKFKNYSIWQRETYRLTLKTSLGSFTLSMTEIYYKVFYQCMGSVWLSEYMLGVDRGRGPNVVHTL